MNHLCYSRKQVAKKVTEASDATPEATVSLERRKFMRLFGAGATSIAVTACGGGGGADVYAAQPVPTPTPTPTPTPEPPAVPPPVWSTVPTLTFTQGTPASISIAEYVSVSGSAALAITLNAGSLPPGVVYNAQTRAFDYDGIGAVAAADSLVLTAVVG